MRNTLATPFRGGFLFFALASSLVLIFLTGCASTPQTTRLLTQANTFPQRHELTEVRFFPQEKYQCGPAALATVLQEAGVNISPEELVPEIYIPARKGSLQIEILASSRRHGRLAYRIESNMDSLLKEVMAGNPVLVLQNLGLSWSPTWHYAVVVGFDMTTQNIILRSGVESRRQTALGTFERTWARSNYWGIVVLPPDQLPATANEERYIKTVTTFEKVNRWEEAQTGYKTALSRWPHNLVAMMGLGNTYYHLNNLEQAAIAFRDAVTHHPDSGPANNNMAQVLLELGKTKEAKLFAERAVSLGGAQLENFKATLREINQQETK